MIALILRFEGLQSVESRQHELVFGPFENLRFGWASFGCGGQLETKEYSAGVAKIVSAIE
ncbi:MAG TPA: hypothetical protein P5555_09760 [Candidatus Paceibacterota bacterium]|nr:hypothetical protein [Candidatus Paceibacterota bacterium]HRZ92891.1 hypothetical protein [Candidatus Paceibacterota bacterium]